MEVTLNEKKYSTGRLDAFQQWHVARRLAPIISVLVQTYRRSDIQRDEKGEVPLESLLSLALGPLSDSLSRMSDTESDYIMKTCLSVCQRQIEGGGWANILAANGKMMYADMDMSDLLGLTIKVIEENLGSFFPSEEQPSPART